MKKKINLYLFKVFFQHHMHAKNLKILNINFHSISLQLSLHPICLSNHIPLRNFGPFVSRKLQFPNKEEWKNLSFKICFFRFFFCVTFNTLCMNLHPICLKQAHFLRELGPICIKEFASPFLLRGNWGNLVKSYYVHNVHVFSRNLL